MSSVDQAKIDSDTFRKKFEDKYTQVLRESVSRLCLIYMGFDSHPYVESINFYIHKSRSKAGFIIHGTEFMHELEIRDFSKLEILVRLKLAWYATNIIAELLGINLEESKRAINEKKDISQSISSNSNYERKEVRL